MNVTENAGPPEVVFRALEADNEFPSVVGPLVEAAKRELPGRPELQPPQDGEYAPSNRGVLLVAYLSRQAAATGGYRAFPGDPTGNTAEIVRMFVRSGARRSGLGRMMLAELEERAWDDEYGQMLLYATEDLTAARALYEMAGYRRHTDFDPRDDSGRLAYVKQLNGQAN